MKMMQSMILIFVSMLILLNFSMFSASESNINSVWYVGGSGEGNMSQINMAIQQAEVDDTIRVYPGVYNEIVHIDKSVKLVGSSEDETIIQGDGFNSVVSISANNVSISFFTIQNSGNYVESTENDSSFDLMVLPVNFSGVFSEGDETSISSCTFIDCWTGLFLRNSSGGTINEITSLDNSQAVYLVNAENVRIKDSYFVGNDIGLYFSQTKDSEVISCNVSSHIHTGIMLTQSQDNIIRSNWLYDNVRGIVLDPDCGGNRFFSNVFIDSVHLHAFDESKNNYWDDGLRGNYWDDYMGVDSDNDGIGDSVYEIPIVGIDRFPLMSAETGSFIDVSISFDSPSHFDGGEGFFVSGSCVSDDEIEQVFISIDGSEWRLAEGTDQWNISFDWGEYGPGTYVIAVYAVSNGIHSSVERFNVTLIDDDETDDPIDDSDDSFNDTVGFSGFFMLISIILLSYKGKRCKKDK
jgi:parallel beta-helix repeat protein